MKHKNLCLFIVCLIFIPFLANALDAVDKNLEAKANTNTRIQEILSFWFGPLESIGSFPDDRLPLWAAQSSEFDRQLKSQFEGDVQKAILGELNEWRQTPEGRLALILLLDQFPRYIYRDKPQIFASEGMVKGLVIEGIQKGDDTKLFPVERIFFYMPLKHSEDISLQNLSVSLYTKLFKDSPESLKPRMQAYLNDAIVNQQTIARFKRFPQRNKILGRQSTPEEIIYINQQRKPNF